jgi:hypothetical protein
MFDVSALLGKDEVIARLKPGLTTAQHGPDRGQRDPGVRLPRLFARGGRDRRCTIRWMWPWKGDLTHAETDDLLADTVDYGRVTAIVKEQMAIGAH